jgi:hypothetical protein
MDLLDFIGDVLMPSIGPSTSRGVMILGIIIGLALASVMGWLVIRFDDPLRTPDWGFGVIVVALLIALVEVLLGLVTAKREPEYHGIATLNVVVNAGVLALVVVAIV